MQNTQKMAWNKGSWMIAIAIAVIVLTFGYVGFNQYRASYPSQLQPLSTRGLPPPETDVPVTLPPDPGEAGKLTLAGIDSDNDGVRDDLQREIVYMYPQNEEVRRVLRAMVKKIQDVIVTTGDHEHFKKLMISAFAYMHCYEYLVFPIGQYDSTNETILWNMAHNTPERKKIIEANEAKATPYVSSINFGSEACTQPLVQGQY